MSYNDCVRNELQKMHFPSNPDGLYSERLYDNQVAKYRCNNATNARNNRTNLIEGFSLQNPQFWETVCKWTSCVIVVLIIIWILVALFKPSQVYEIDIPTSNRLFLTDLPDLPVESAVIR